MTSLSLSSRSQVPGGYVFASFALIQALASSARVIALFFKYEGTLPYDGNFSGRFGGISAYALFGDSFHVTSKRFFLMKFLSSVIKGFCFLGSMLAALMFSFVKAG